MNPGFPTAARVLSVLALVSGTYGCVAGQRMIAGRKDYAMYRDYRLAETNLLRLRYGNRYLKEMPAGRFRGEVAAWFQPRDAAYYRQARDRPSLLRAYLAALPDGPHAEQAIDRLIELDMLREYRDKEARAQEEKLRRVADELERAARGRELLVKELTEWTGGFSMVQRFGGPTEALPRELLDKLTQSEPRMRCDGDRCGKTLHVEYAVPSNRRLLQRKASIELELELHRGLVRSVTLAGPGLFSRVGEALSLAPVEANDFSARVDAIARSVALIGNVLEARLPKASCDRDAVAPVVLVRECAGVRVELFAGDDPSANDGIVIRASAKSVRPRGSSR